MAPPVATSTAPASEAVSNSEPAYISLKATNGVHHNGSGATPDLDAVEDYAGHYKFAPIEEAQVSRAMIKR